MLRHRQHEPEERKREHFSRALGVLGCVRVCFSGAKIGVRYLCVCVTEYSQHHPNTNSNPEVETCFVKAIN